MKKALTISLVYVVLLTSNILALTQDEIPSSLAGLKIVGNKLVAEIKGTQYQLADETSKMTISMLRGNPRGTSDGIEFSFLDANTQPMFVDGTLFYALIDLENEKYPQPKWKRETSIDSSGRALADIKNKLSGKYDFIDWQKKARGTLCYRVADASGDIEFEGEIGFIGSDNFSVDAGSIIEGPFLNQLKDKSVVITFETHSQKEGVVSVDGVGEFITPSGLTHEIKITGLTQDTLYNYSVSAGGQQIKKASFKTAPTPGARKPFSFAFTSDSRSGSTMGETELSGVNVYMMKKFSALAAAKGVKFFQFTGDMINGYNNAIGLQEIEYTTWKHAIANYASYFPFYTAMGNHEALVYAFDDTTTYGLTIDRFPYDTFSAEAIYKKHFSNPKASEVGGFINPNGANYPPTEDGAYYDPDPNKTDFPSYCENVYYYTYDNIAMVVLNSNYWFSPNNPGQHPKQNTNYIGGNPHSYIMDNQLGWLKNTLKTLDEDKNIDFIFITAHTPAFPNGGHVDKDMWFLGKNSTRPYIADAHGNIKAVEKGIIDRRDEYIKILLDSKKAVAMFTGDEHNYARLDIAPNMPIYDETQYVPEEKLVISRNIWQLHSGTAGAPYYAYEQAPWNSDLKDSSTKEGGKYLKKFSTQHALIIIHVDGKSLELEVVNPATLTRIE
ncbi:MAG: metallophosphoesterase [Campylobacterota bacterium]|nr:metallophosphoesterase [Campylobacterota bacterium]